jgi:uroporphyrinogen III methyltransferase / synthase
VRGLELLRSAHVVVYDQLVSAAILAEASRAAIKIYVGKHAGAHCIAQDHINGVLVDYARMGYDVVRLKGGDPFVFGRGGEEAEAVAAAGVDFEVVPGVTAAVAVPAYAGIPVTHRTLASTVTIVTGHEDADKPAPVLEWPKLASTSGTLVFMMGMKNLPTIVAKLLSEGRAPHTPVAIVRWGTRAEQQTIVGALVDIVGKAEAARFEPPTVIVIGEVVRLREQLSWFEKRPLFGKRIVTTRAQEQTAEFSHLLVAYGAEPVELPTIHLIPPASWEAVDQAISKIDHYDWLIFTSVNGVTPFMRRVQTMGKDARAFAKLRIGCIGPRTAQELGQFGLKADLVPAEYQAEGIIAALSKERMRGSRVLIPRAEVAREILPDQLRELGAKVDVVSVYRTIVPAVDVEPLKQQLQEGRIDVVTFTSSSTVRNFVELLGGAETARRLVAQAAIACIGPITARTSEEYGLNVTILPAHNTVPALAEAIAKHYSEGVGVGMTTSR